MRKRLIYIILGLLVAMFIIINGFSNVLENTITSLNLSDRIEKVVGNKP